MAGGGLVVFGALFLPWNERLVIQVLPGPDPHPTGWEAFEIVDAVLAALACSAVVLSAVGHLARARSLDLVLATISVATVGVVLYSYLGPAITGPVDYPSIGVLTGLCGAGAMTLGSVRTLRAAR